MVLIELLLAKKKINFIAQDHKAVYFNWKLNLITIIKSRLI
jgi:hypothetical protein